MGPEYQHVYVLCILHHLCYHNGIKVPKYVHWVILILLKRISAWVEVRAKEVMGHHSDIDIPLS